MLHSDDVNARLNETGCDRRRLYLSRTDRLESLAIFSGNVANSSVSENAYKHLNYVMLSSMPFFVNRHQFFISVCEGLKCWNTGPWNQVEFSERDFCFPNRQSSKSFTF